MGPGDVRHIGRRGAERVCEARVRVHAQVRLEPKVPLVALLRSAKRRPVSSCRFEQVAEAEEGGGVGHALPAEIDPGQGAQRLAVVHGVCERLIGQRRPLLQKAEAQACAPA